MILLKKMFLVFILFFTAVVPAASQEKMAGEDVPIKVYFENSSRFQVQVHVLSYDMIVTSYVLEPRQNMEIDVEYGHTVRLEYQPNPQQTEFSQMGSLNELYRRIYLRNDGDNLFIQEKFSGQRVKRKGTKRIPRSTISEPDMNLPLNREPDMVPPEDKKNQIDLDNFKQQRQKIKDKKNKKTRKEDPTQPERKTEKQKQ